MLTPSIVDQSRLQNGKLLNDEQKRKALEFFARNPKAVLYAGEEALPYPVARSKEGKLFALYASANQLHYTPAETSKLAFQNESEISIKPLGGGASAIVVAAQSLEDDGWFAAKCQTTTRDEEPVRQEIAREQRVLRAMNLAKGSVTVEQVNTMLDPHSTTTITIMELAPGKKLETLIDEDKSKSSDQKMPLEQKLDLAIKAAKRTDELAKRKLVQCDFNPKNIMCHISSPTEAQVSLIDFGEVYELDDNGEFFSKNKIPDTPGFGAPEVSRGGYFSKKGAYSENTMAFSLGKTLSAFLQTTDLVPDQNITQKAMQDVVRKLSSLDPNQRINAELAVEELAIISEYHALLKRTGGLDSHKALPLLDHMRKMEEGKGGEQRAALQTLERRLLACQHKQSVYQHRCLEKNLNHYIQDCKREGKSKSYVKDMEKLLKKIQKLDPNQLDFAIDLENLRTKAYAKHAQFDAKMLEKQSKEPVKVVGSVMNWVRSFSVPSLKKSASFSHDTEKLSKSAPTLSTTGNSLSRDPSSSSISSSSSRPLLSTPSSISLNDNPLYSVERDTPSPVVMSRNNYGKPLPPTPSRSPRSSPSQESRPPSPENRELVNGFSPSFKLDLERRLVASDSKIKPLEEVTPDSPKTKTKRGTGA